MADEKLKATSDKDRVSEYELCLLKLYGAIVGGKELRHILGYRTGDAFRQAVRRKQLPIPTFIPEGRKTRMARTHDIAKWLVSIDANLDEHLLDENSKK